MSSLAIALLLASVVANEPPAPRKPGRYYATQPEPDVQPPVKAVGTLFGTGGVFITRNVVQASGTLGGSGGVLFGSGIGVEAVALVTLSPDSLGLLQLYSVGLAVRFGRKSHVAIGAAPTLGIAQLQVFREPIIGITAAIFARGALVLGDVFMLVLQPIVFTNGVGISFGISGGIGAQF